MKPKPFSALNHFTVPCATCAPTFMRRTTPLDRGAGVSLFRPSNTNVELEPRGRYNKKARKTGPPRRIDTGPRSAASRPVALADEAGCPDRLQRRLDAVRRAHDR